MHGYSDRINHALAFAAKYYGTVEGPERTMDYLAHPANIAIILARYGCEDLTVVAGILHRVLEETPPAGRAEMEAKVLEKFGPVVLATAREVLEPRHDALGRLRSWRACKREYLIRIADAEPRGLDICAADELHNCAAAIRTVRRLGTEYLHADPDASPSDTLWWFGAITAHLSSRREWRHRGMLDELEAMSRELAIVLQVEP
jgi:(p)ppGpp synthase/HD superfamily hydrolase